MKLIKGEAYPVFDLQDVWHDRQFHTLKWKTMKYLHSAFGVEHNYCQTYLRVDIFEFESRYYVVKPIVSFDSDSKEYSIKFESDQSYNSLPELYWTEDSPRYIGETPSEKE